MVAFLMEVIMDLKLLIEKSYGKITEEELAFAVIEISNEVDAKKRSFNTFAEYLNLLST
jgi:hypothetical protein